MIQVEGVHQGFGRRAVLAGVDLTVEAGRVTLLLGANGAGKTTLLRAIVGLSRPDRGRIVVAGHDLARERAAVLARLAFLPQSPRFHPRLRTAEIAHFYGRLRGRSAVEVDAALGSWGLAGHRDVRTAQLSGGLRQHLALAVFFLAAAPVLVLDEPGLSLDPHWRGRLQQELARRAAAGATVLVATHLLGEWRDQAGNCVLLESGALTTGFVPGGLAERFRPEDACCD